MDALGLDISTSCTGWCILGPDGTLKDMGYIPLSHKKDPYMKAQEVCGVLEDIKSRYSITSVYIEENLQAFRPGLSSAKTLLSLARFNGIVSYISQTIFKLSPEYINVNVARKTNGIKIIKKSKGGAPTKDQILEWVSSQISYDWPKKILKSGPRKGQEIFDPGCFDAADAYVIATAGIKISKLQT